MKEFKLNLHGMTCGSCEKLIQKVAQENNAEVKEISANEGQVTLVCEEEKLDVIKQQLAQKGFSEKNGNTEQRGDFENVKRYILAVVAGEANVHVESLLMNYTIGSVIALIIISALAYNYLWGNIENSGSYIPLILLGIIAAVITVFSYQHVKCYRKNMSCTNGMMVGMTMGMISGFSIGALIGATNGMFIGSVVGMAFGIVLGILVGRHCGIMGAMEGIMAGFMSGLMGAMSSIMLLNDNLILFLYILFGVCTILIGGLSYMMYREAGSAPKEELSTNFSSFLGISMAIWLILSAFMIYGPKAAVVYP